MDSGAKRPHLQTSQVICSKMAVQALAGFVFCFASVKKVGFTSVDSGAEGEEVLTVRGSLGI